MNFDEAVKHVREGTATEEEKEFVRNELDAVNRMMDFDDAIKHVREGTATAEEKDFVRRQLGIASQLMTDDEKVQAAPIREADKKEVRQAKKKFKLRYVIIPAVVIVCVVLVIGAILGGVFGFAASSAKDAMRYDKNACVQIAKDSLEEYVAREYPEAVVRGVNQDGKVDLNFSYNGASLKKSYYTCLVELKGSAFYGGRICEVEAEIVVDTRTGDVMTMKVEFDD